MRLARGGPKLDVGFALEVMSTECRARPLKVDMSQSLDERRDLPFRGTQL